MRLRGAVSISLIALLGAFVPTGTNADVPAASISPVDVSVIAGSAALRATGTVAGLAPFRVAVYAAFGPDIPTALLTRRALTTDAGGHFDTNVPIAPAYFRGAVITVIVQTADGVTAARGRTTIEDPTLAAPARSASPTPGAR